jgi:putative acetyltransferase
VVEIEVMQVRRETLADRAGIHLVHQQAFRRDAEALLVHELREAGALVVSLVAEEDQAIIGHIAFSPVVIYGSERHIRAVGLGPIGVIPAHQRRGIGSQLVEVGLRSCRAMGWELAFVLGDPNYYHRFGFDCSAVHGFEYEHEVPEPVFMVRELLYGRLDEAGGLVRYHQAFDSF